VWNADNKLSEVKNGSTTLAQFFYDVRATTYSNAATKKFGNLE
jgi:hypothetical protein